MKTLFEFLVCFGVKKEVEPVGKFTRKLFIISISSDAHWRSTGHPKGLSIH